MRARISSWLLDHIPERVAAAPERVLINAACALIGLAALITVRPGSLLALWPWWMAYVWPLTMIGGGVAALVGYWNASRREWANSVERTGYLAILLATLVYGVGLTIVFGWQGAFSGLLFLGIAAAKAVRLLVTSASRDYLLRSENPGDHS